MIDPVDRIPWQAALLAPRSVAVVGASDRPQSVGAAVFGNLLQGGFGGAVWPVNPRHPQVAGRVAFARVGDLPAVPDLAVICTPPRAVPAVVADLAALGTRAAVVLTAGLDAPGDDGLPLIDAALRTARPAGLRLLGPNCVGLRVPRIGLNASFARIPARDGPIALVAQSGGVITAFLSWAATRGLGFSCCVSLGNANDLGAAELLRVLADDAGTQAILLYLESVRDGAAFIEAARAAAGRKPVFALKSGRASAGAQAAATHTGALAGADNVWEAALLAAGVRRLDTLRELFGVAEILGRGPMSASGPLAIVTNSGGPAVLAVDALGARHGELATLPADAVARLDAVLPATWSRRNPVDIIGDAPSSRFAQALDVVRGALPDATALLLHAPTDMAPAAAVRAAVQRHLDAGVVSCWTGEHAGGAALPGFTVPEEAVDAIVHVAAARRMQRDAAQAATAPAAPPASLGALRAMLRAESAAGRTLLRGELVNRVLRESGVPVIGGETVATEADLAGAAARIGYPLVLKIVSPQITHKSDVGGVVVGIGDAVRLQHEAAALRERCARLRPDAVLEGFLLQPLAAPAHARELIIGITRDPVFGPVVLFGHGGTAVHVINDTAIGIPPFDARAARALVARTRVAALLDAWRDTPAVDADALAAVLVNVGSLALAVPEIAELDINPLLASPAGAMALDARIRLA